MSVAPERFALKSGPKNRVGRIFVDTLRNGMGAESLAWTFMFVMLPLTCVYYPVAVLPAFMHPIAWALPPTYVFEGMRALLIEHTFRLDLMLEALALNVVLFIAMSRSPPTRKKKSRSSLDTTPLPLKIVRTTHSPGLPWLR